MPIVPVEADVMECEGDATPYDHVSMLPGGEEGVEGGEMKALLGCATGPFGCGRKYPRDA
jgi:hypothetical protein